jgi:hypothetical protein
MDNANLFKDIIIKIERIRRLNITGAQKMKNATEECVQRFSSLIRRIESTVKNTREILDLMKKKMTVGVARDRMENPKDIRAKYELLLGELNEQMSLNSEQKTEEISRLNNVLNKIISIDNKKETRTDLSEVAHDIENAVKSLKSSADIESGFILSTILLLQDMVLSLADSFISLNAMMENTLGQSSSFRDDISEIVVNLQCEDICQEMSGITTDVLSSLIKDLYELNIDGVTKEDINMQTVSKNTYVSDEVTFFE